MPAVRAVPTRRGRTSARAAAQAVPITQQLLIVSGEPRDRQELLRAGAYRAGAAMPVVGELQQPVLRQGHDHGNLTTKVDHLMVIACG